MTPLRIHPKDFAAVLALALAAWFAWYSASSQFGFYDDDYNTITPHLYGTWGLTFDEIRGDVLSFRQGKPVCYALIRFLARLAGALGGKGTAYLFAFGILATSGALAYAFLRRIRLGRFVALAGSLAFLLGPADTSRAFLCHAFGIQVGFLFLWTALHLYLSKRGLAAWIFAALTLLTYEPLLVLFWAGSFWRAEKGAALKQGIGVGIALVVSLGVRFAVQEKRVAHLKPADAAKKIALNLEVGPTAALGAWVERAAFGGSERWLAFLGFLVLFAWLAKEASEVSPARLAALAVLLIALGYCGDLLNDPTKVSGRPSRVHSAAGFGLSWLLAAAAAWASRSRRRAWAVASLLAWAFSGWVAYGRRVQGDYRDAWSSQQTMWRSLAEQTADLQGTERILLEFPDGKPEFRETTALGWSLNLISKQTFLYPARPSAPTVHVRVRNRRPGEAVVLRWKGGAFRRVGPRGLPVRRAPLPIWGDFVG